MNYYETLKLFKETKLDMAKLRIAYELNSIFNWHKYTQTDFEIVATMCMSVYYEVNSYDVNIICNRVYDLFVTSNINFYDLSLDKIIEYVEEAL